MQINPNDFKDGKYVWARGRNSYHQWLSQQPILLKYCEDSKDCYCEGPHWSIYTFDMDAEGDQYGRELLKGDIFYWANDEPVWQIISECKPPAVEDFTEPQEGNIFLLG